MNAGAAFGTSLGRQGSTDTVTFALSGTTTDNGSATFPSDTQVTLSGYDDTLNFTGSNSTLTLAAQAGEAVPRSERDLMDVGPGRQLGLSNGYKHDFSVAVKPTIIASPLRCPLSATADIPSGATRS